MEKIFNFVGSVFVILLILDAVLWLISKYIYDIRYLVLLVTSLAAMAFLVLLVVNWLDNQIKED